MISQLSPFLTLNSQSSDLFSLHNGPKSPTIPTNYGTPFGYFYAPMNQTSDATPIAVSTGRRTRTPTPTAHAYCAVRIYFHLFSVSQTQPNHFVNQFPDATSLNNYPSPYSAGVPSTTTIANMHHLPNEIQRQESSEWFGGLCKQLIELYNLGHLSPDSLKQLINHSKSLRPDVKIDNNKPDKEYLCHLCWTKEHFKRDCPLVCLHTKRFVISRHSLFHFQIFSSNCRRVRKVLV